MIIRYASSGDLSEIQHLWALGFPGEEEFSRIYFRDYFNLQNTLIVQDRGKLCAMLQVFPYLLKIGRRVDRVSYIYGACTHPQYRGRGIMRFLFANVERLRRTAGDAATVLIPQERRLFDYYRRLGYKQGFFIKNSQWTIRPGNRSDVNLRQAEYKDVERMNALYEHNVRLTDGFIVRLRDDWLKQMALFRATGGDVFYLDRHGECAAYGFVSEKKGLPWIQEGCAMDSKGLSDLANGIGSAYGREQVLLSTCVSYGESGEPIGCIKFLSSERPICFSGYMNLMYN
ncbi:GNAT family N-acetyltransferase [Sporolactobacillus sp. CQH2019]|uniref:GNAT family N-acetyltransferase n=1 Tax=Sporolactobacillus sp. CQH2019 TaxID=3023512 RepID=UPI002367C91A|nr:GNAT family N-acetyltransferase [Sporolactobacillus sp. CQH2019]MDD9146960.1 GNAT family N-acetyltransferase [Sporolactobacillus sp. CQH2019]